MIVDSSAIIAIVRDEPERSEFTRLIEGDARPRMSATSLVECLMVAGPERADVTSELVSTAGLDIVPFDEQQAQLAVEAHFRYGRRSGSQARLNLGDCMAYALAKVTGEPLLFKGDDFTHTDLTPAR